MTATPIPRTLTLTLYGEMDVSRLDEMPPGRQPIETRVISDERLGDVIDGARPASGGGAAGLLGLPAGRGKREHRCAPPPRSAPRCFSQRFGDDKVGLVHGRMKGPEKDAVMAPFASGDTGVLVATTVIEVGVDVPNATLMIVEHAERFGLAQLHQLRGRVGRGTGASRCLLLRGTTLSETARARLALMRETNDGFRIAEEDLRLRGAGEILGTRQSGEQAVPASRRPSISPSWCRWRWTMRACCSSATAASKSERGQAARMCLYLFERDAAIGLLRSG